MIKLLLEEDRAGVLADMAHVTRNFQMPGVGLVPDYDARIAVMRDAGVDRNTFLQKVYFPVLSIIRLQSSRAFDSSPDSTTSFTMCGGMNHMPSRSARTTSPGITSVLPIRTGMLMPVTITRMP